MSGQTGSEEQIAEGSPQAKRRKIVEKSESPEEESIDENKKENFWATLPPEVAETVLSRLPYETIAQLAYEQEDGKRIEFGLLDGGAQWAREAGRKWMARDWSPAFALEDAVRQRVNAAWRILLSAFRDVVVWTMDREEMMPPKYHEDFSKMGRALDQAEKCHRHMEAIVAAIQAR